MARRGESGRLTNSHRSQACRGRDLRCTLRDVVGLAPGQHLAACRVAEAQVLLRQGWRLKQVAERVDYGSASALTRAFYSGGWEGTDTLDGRRNARAQCRKHSFRRRGVEICIDATADPVATLAVFLALAFVPIAVDRLRDRILRLGMT